MSLLMSKVENIIGTWRSPIRTVISKLGKISTRCGVKDSHVHFKSTQWCIDINNSFNSQSFWNIFHTLRTLKGSLKFHYLRKNRCCLAFNRRCFPPTPVLQMGDLTPLWLVVRGSQTHSQRTWWSWNLRWLCTHVCITTEGWTHGPKGIQYWGWAGMKCGVQAGVQAEVIQPGYQSGGNYGIKMQSCNQQTVFSHSTLCQYWHGKGFYGGGLLWVQSFWDRPF